MNSDNQCIFTCVLEKGAWDHQQSISFSKWTFRPSTQSPTKHQTLNLGEANSSWKSIPPRTAWGIFIYSHVHVAIQATSRTTMRISGKHLQHLATQIVSAIVAYFGRGSLAFTSRSTNRTRLWRSAAWVCKAGFYIMILEFSLISGIACVEASVWQRVIYIYIDI